jgi:hypothetical protein
LGEEERAGGQKTGTAVVVVAADEVAVITGSADEVVTGSADEVMMAGSSDKVVAGSTGMLLVVAKPGCDGAVSTGGGRLLVVA